PCRDHDPGRALRVPALSMAAGTHAYIGGPDGRRYRFIDLHAKLGAALARTPWVTRLFLENQVRRSAAGDDTSTQKGVEIEFFPAGILMHDTTCVPALVDIAAMRDVIAESGGDPKRFNPVLPIDVSTDHSLGVDFFGTHDAMARNMAREMER